jgi:hypothetical protein
MTRRFLGFGREVRADPVADAALERDGAIALTNQLGRDVRTGQLVGVGIVDDNLAIMWQRRRTARNRMADRARQAKSAVLVRVFQSGVDQDGRRTAVQTLLQVFFRDSRNRHDRYFVRPARRVST